MKEQDEYYLLTEQLDEIEWALDGQCDDIDCDQYMYRELLKKKHKPVLEHSFSCMEKLKRDKAALLRLLSLKRFRKYRFTKCAVCKKSIDTLHKKNTIVSYTRPADEGYFEVKLDYVHGSCEKRFRIPKGWEKV